MLHSPVLCSGTGSIENLYFQILIFQCYRVKPMRRLYIKWQYKQCHAPYQHNIIHDAFVCNFRSVGRYSSLGGAPRSNRIVLYGKNLIPIEKL